jgi:hypothetical protein
VDGGPAAHTPAQLAAQLDQLMANGAELSARLDFRLTPRRAFLLVLASAAPIGAPEIRAAVTALAGTSWHRVLRRLTHQHAAYIELWRLESFGALRREKHGRRVYFVIQPTARAVIRSQG